MMLLYSRWLDISTRHSTETKHGVWDSIATPLPDECGEDI